MRRRNGVVLARALGCPWLLLVGLGGAPQLSSFLSPRFGVWIGGLQGYTVTGGAVWPGGSCQGKSVCRSHALGGGRGSRQLWAGAQNQKRKKKSQKVQLWPVLGPSLCNPASLPAQATAGMGPEWPHLPAFGIQSPALLYATLRTRPLFPQIPKSENHPRRFLPCMCVPCACTCAPACL